MTQGHEAQAELAGHGLGLGQMLADLLADVMHGLERRARQLELAAGLQADIAGAPLQPDQGVAELVVLIDPGPAEALQAGHQGVDAAAALVVRIIGNGLMAAGAVDELFVLGADAVLAFGLAAAGQVFGHGLKGERRPVHLRDFDHIPPVNTAGRRPRSARI